MKRTGEAGTVGRKTAFGVAAMVGVLLVGAAAAFACTPSARLETRPSRGEAGAVVDVQGNTFDVNGAPVNIRWGSGSGPILATVAVNEAGQFAAQITVPADVPKNGFYLLQASQRRADSSNFWVASVPFEVFGVQAQPEPAPQPAPQPTVQQQPAASAAPVGPTEQAAAPAADPAPSRTPATQAPRAVTQPAAQPAAQPVAAAVATTLPAPVAEAAAAPVQAEVTVEAAPTAEPQPAAVATPASEQPPLVLSDPSSLGAPRTVDSGPSPWVLVPMALIGLGLFGISSAIVVSDLRGKRARADI